jgi:TRAP-type C4-dicarboxylate transport system substrate-binding protein
MKKRWLIVLVVFLVVTLGLVAQDKTYVLRFNTTSGPASDLVAAMNKFAEVAAALSGGKIDVRVAHSGQLGDQKTALLGVMKGSLEIGRWSGRCRSTGT